VSKLYFFLAGRIHLWRMLNTLAQKLLRAVWLPKTPSEKGLVRRDEIFPAVACQGSRRVRGVELNGISSGPLGVAAETQNPRENPCSLKNFP
jgi:hypothetical protein